MVALLLHVLSTYAKQKPLVIILEDLHWTDPTSLSLLQEVFKKVNSVLVIMTTRSFGNLIFNRTIVYQQLLDPKSVEFPSECKHEIISLAPLTEEHITEVIKKKLHVKE